MTRNQFFSSLVINGKKYPSVHQVFNPRYNKEFFKRVSARVDQLESQIEKRCRNNEIPKVEYDLTRFKHDSQRFIRLKERLEKPIKSEEEVLKIKEDLNDIGETLLPFVTTIPNRCSKHVPHEELLVDEIKPEPIKQPKLSKVLSHIKLSYINNCYSKSVVGPNSYYYQGIGAKLQYGLSDFFSSQMSKNSFIPVSGMCLTKSAVVEASNCRDLKDYTTDPCRVLTDSHNLTTLHLVEASRESLVGLVSTLGSLSSNNPLRLMTSGASYRKGSDWFDSNQSHVSQFQTLHALTLTSSIEQYSMKEYLNSKDLIWNIYKELNLPTRLVHCSLETMLPNEYDAHRIDVWLPSVQQWIQVGRVSHYLDYITVRTGLRRGHIIDSTVYDSQSLIAAIIENNQTYDGKFIIPSVIKDHMIHLTESENLSYFRINMSRMTSSNIMNDFEQRRYLVKRSTFGHSRDAAKVNSVRHYSGRALPAAFLMLVGTLVDWHEAWFGWVPTRLKRVLYDNIYRPSRRVWHIFVYPLGTNKPEDLTFDEILKTGYYDRNVHERNKEICKQFQPKVE